VFDLRNNYMAFGYVIDSPVPLPEAYPIDSGAEADVIVKIDTVSDDFHKDDFYDHAREHGEWWQYVSDKTRTLFNCQSGLYDVRNGNEIVMQLYPGVDMEKAKIFLLGSAMGAIQVQRGRVPVHGGAVLTSRGAYIITGGQGAGKSTMTSAFVHNGYKYLTDDVSSICFENDQANIIPAYPQRKLVRDACAPLGFDPDSLIIVDSDRDKLAVRDRDNWQSEQAVLSAIIELYPEPAGSSVSVELVTGRHKLDCVTKNMYRMWMHVPGGDLDPSEFKKILRIAAQADIYRVGVPRGINEIASIAREIAAGLGV